MGRFWVINMGYDSGSITIYTQTTQKDKIDFAHQTKVAKSVYLPKK